MTRSTSDSRVLVEAVETRRLFAALNIVGTAGADNIYVNANATYVTVTMNGTSTNYTAVRSITISAGTGDDLVNIDSNVQLGVAISGNSGNDRLYGGALNDTITGNNGNDYIDGNGGDDALIGNDGADTLVASVGNDDAYAFDATSNTDGDVDYLYDVGNNSASIATLHYSPTEDVLKTA